MTEATMIDTTQTRAVRPIATGARPSALTVLTAAWRRLSGISTAVGRAVPPSVSESTALGLTDAELARLRYRPGVRQPEDVRWNAIVHLHYGLRRP